MKSFKSWFNIFLMVLLLTVIIDISVSATKHPVAGKTNLSIAILSILLGAIVFGNLFFKQKNKNKR